VGQGNFASGYSNYGSLGRYEITGTVPASGVSAPSITSAASARAVIGVPFSFHVTASNSPTSYAASGLPTGLAFDTTSGAISGTPSLSLSSGPRTITLSATNAGGTGSQTFTLTLVSAFADWGQNYGIDVGSLANADPDGDGLANLLEYAFDQSPNAPQSTPVTAVSTVNANGVRLEITFVRPNNRPDLLYTVEVSSDLVNWTAGHAYGSSASNGGGLPTQEIERTSLGAAGERIRVRDIGGTGRRFLRVKVTSQ
jgi:hypothetical protein